jgi:hypothetical protein
MGALSGLSGLSSMSGMLPSGIVPTTPEWDNTITINWSAPGVAVNRKNYAINAYRALDPVVTADPDYQNLLNEIDPQFIRIHSLDMMKDSTQFDLGWVVNPDSEDYSWDTAKIQAALTPLVGEISLTICRFPSAICDSAGKLLVQHELDFANFCVDLIAIVQQTGVNLVSVGLLNELDAIYGDDNSWHSAWTIARNDLKASYPNLAIGGATFANPWAQARLDAYMQSCGQLMDYFAVNSYATGSVAGSNPQVLWHHAADGVKGLLMFLRWRLDEAQLWSKPIQLSEAGLSYSLDIENSTAIRGIWEGLRLIHTATEPGEGILAWNEADDFHGLNSSPSSGFMRRMASHVYESFNEWMDGQSFPVSITGKTVTIPNTAQTVVPSISALAVVNGDTGHAVAIVNRSEESRMVRVIHSGWTVPSGFWCQRWVISSDATAQLETIETNSFTAGEFSIAPNSIHLYQAIDPGS